MPDKYAENSFVYDLNLIGGKLFIKIDPGHQMIVMDPDTGTIEAEFVAYSHSPSAIASPDEKVAYYTYGSHLYEYHLETKTTNPVMIGDNPATLGQTAIGWDFVQLDDPDYPGPTLFGFIGNYEGKAFKYNLQTRALKVMTLPLPPQPTDIYNVASGPDGNIYSNGYISGGVGVYSPDTGKLVRYTGGVGQSESIFTLGDKMYFGVYGDAKIYEYDPSQPWKANQNPRLLFSMQSESQNRPHAMTGSEEHHKLFIGTAPYYGQLGGAFAVYDTVTGEKQVYRNIVPNQSVISLAYKDGKVYAGTSIYGGDASVPVEKEAKLFVWDVATGKKIRETVPVPGETAIGALLVGPDGNIWGFAQGTLFIYDPETGEVIYREEKFPNLHYLTGGVDLEIGLDGHIYGTAGGKFFKIDPADKKVTILRDSNSHFLAQDRMGNLYFKNGPSAPYGNTLWRYTLEDKTISVTGVTLDRAELNLSPGDTAELKAEVEPAFATNRTVFWQSDNLGVATVDENGKVKAMAPGTAKITATTEDGGMTATCTVSVK